MALVVTKITKTSDVSGQNDSGLYGTLTYDVYFTGQYNGTSVKTSGFSGLPTYRSDHPDNSLMYASDVKCELPDGNDPLGTSDNPSIAKLTATYAQKTLQFAVSPCSRPPKITGGGTDLMEVRIKDKDDNAVVNSAGELYEGIPPYPLGQKALDFVITQNECTNPATNAATYSNTVNADAWHGVAIGKARFGKITFEKVQEEVPGSGTVTYWVVTYPIFIRDDGWRLKLIDCGWHYLVDTDDDGTVDTARRATDDAGRTGIKPYLLDGAGGLLNDTGFIEDAGADPVIYSNTTTTTDGYQMLDETTWGTLSLPDPFV